MPSDIVLPAHAGMIPVTGIERMDPESAPRTRGDDPEQSHLIPDKAECSPHTRG